MIYMDNAATSFPKAPGVGQAMLDYIENVGVNINRSVYMPAAEAGLQVLALREKLCALFHHDSPNRVIFTAGATAALNFAIKGFLHEGDHVLVSAMEHNAVMRPLVQLGVDFDRIDCDEEGFLRLDSMEALIRPETRLCVLNHASNVCGSVQDVGAVSRICRKHGIPLVLDASQSAGHIPIDFQALGLAALAVPGHKGLLGPQGIGALLLSKDFAESLSPLIAGGTGSMSDSEELPPYLPDRFESGTSNLPGIYGWLAALEYLKKIGPEARQQQEQMLTERLIRGIAGIEGVQLIGSKELHRRVAVVAVDYLRRDNAEAADLLEQEFGILTRCGLHCAPSAHKTLGTFPRGVVRFSPDWNTTVEEIDQTLAAIAATV